MHKFLIKKLFTKSIKEIIVELHPIWMSKSYLQNPEAHWDKKMDEKVQMNVWRKSAYSSRIQ